MYLFVYEVPRVVFYCSTILLPGTYVVEVVEEQNTGAGDLVCVHRD